MSRIAALLLALFLAGCAADAKSILTGGTSLTAPVQNPINTNELYYAESAYAIAVRTALSYRQLRMCRSSETASITNVCARRSVIVQLQAADLKARGALNAAKNFVKNNPTLDAFSAISAAKQAVADFQAALDSNGVK